MRRRRRDHERRRRLAVPLTVGQDARKRRVENLVDGILLVQVVLVATKLAEMAVNGHMRDYAGADPVARGLKEPTSRLLLYQDQRLVDIVCAMTAKQRKRSVDVVLGAGNMTSKDKIKLLTSKLSECVNAEITKNFDMSLNKRGKSETSILDVPERDLGAALTRSAVPSTNVVHGSGSERVLVQARPRTTAMDNDVFSFIFATDGA